MNLPIHTYASEGVGSVNTHWIEAPEGLIVIDGQRQLSEARRALALMQASGKPIKAIFITHGHPDHVGGLQVFVDAAGAGVPIYASELTRRTVAEDAQGFMALAHKILGDDFPAHPLLPTHLLTENEVVQVAGLTLATHEMGAGEAPSLTVITVADSDVLFTGDLVSNRFTPLLTEGHSLAWQQQLVNAPGQFPDVRRGYPGHGQPTDFRELVRLESEYLQLFHDLVKAAMTADGKLSDEAKATITAAMEARYPNQQVVADIPDLVGLNATAVAQELAAAARATTTAA